MREEEAHYALEHARAMQDKVRPLGGWYLIYGVVFSAVSTLLILALGLSTNPTAHWAASVLFAVVTAALLLWAATRKVVPRGFAWLHGLGMIGWGVLYGVTLILGNRHFPGEATWWVGGALACAVPPLVAGFLALRRARSDR